jgi:hypothetical protein
MNPFDRDLENDMEGSGKNAHAPSVDLRQFHMQPRRDGEIAENRLFFSQFRPAAFQHLGQWPEDTLTWYLKFFVHFVPIVDEETGKTFKKQVLCEPSMNKYARERLTSPQMVFPPPFPEITTCEFCEKSQDFWDAFSEAKAEAGIEGVSTEDYKRMMNENPQIAALKEQARGWSASERVYFVVFDYAKFVDQKRVGEDIRLQAYWGNNKVLKGLFKEYKGGFKFFDPQGTTPIVKVERNNTNGYMRADYDVRTINEPGTFDDTVLDYLLGMQDIPDPFDFIEIWPAGQKLSYLQQEVLPVPEKAAVEEPAESPAPPTKPVVFPRVGPKPTEEAAPPDPTPPATPTPTENPPKREKVNLADMKRFGP